jgi:hypothetical protein
MRPEGPIPGISWRRIRDEAGVDLAVRTVILLFVGAYLVGVLGPIFDYDADIVQWPVLIVLWLLMAGHRILELRGRSSD